MDTCLFTTLPPELILDILESADSFAEVAALIRTARIFYDIWELNATTISHTILPRVINCVSDAQELVSAKERAHAQQQHQQRSVHEAAIHRTKRFLSDARTVSLACDFFEADVVLRLGVHGGMHPPDLTSTERTRFKHSYYRAWTFLALSGAPQPQERPSFFLAAMDTREFLRRRDVTGWVWFRRSKDYEIQLGVVDAGKMEDDGSWERGLDMILEHWSEKMGRTTGDRRLNMPDYVPQTLLSVFDHWQDLCGHVARDNMLGKAI